MLHAEVLGQPAADSALWVWADSGQGQQRLLFDCGEGVLAGLPFAEVQATDHLFFSHLHMDHVAGFDSFFRATFDRTARENHIWGPPGTAQIIGHRFQGYWWNYAADLRSHWLVHEVNEGSVETFRFEGAEAFAAAHRAGVQPHGGLLLDTPEVQVRPLFLQHHGLCLGYRVDEPPRRRVRTERLAALGLRPGPWLAALKAGATGPLAVGDGWREAAELRGELLQETAGDSLAYLTDFRLDAAELARLAPLLSGVGTLYAEAQYTPADADLAARHDHTTVTQVAQLAAQAGVSALTLLHLSRRYRPEDWAEMQRAAREHFPAAQFPVGWLAEV